MAKEIIADDKLIDNIEIELEQAKKVRDQAIKNEFDLKKELKERDQRITELDKQNKELVNNLNKLSALFEEQYQIIADIALAQQLNQKNLQNSKQLLDLKIKQFNEGENK